MTAKDVPKIHEATRGYLDFLNLGGELRFADLTSSLIRKYVKRSIPILTGLSSTYLYRSPRESGDNDEWDDVGGEPSGHFVVLYGYNKEERTVMVADPFLPNPYSESHHYLINKAIRTQIGIILETAEPREVHHFATLFGYGADCINPYLAYAALIMAGLDGVRRKLDPRKLGFGPYEKNLYELSPKELARIRSLPSSLDKALDALKEDTAYLTRNDVFPQPLIDQWVSSKAKDIEEMRRVPHPWEIARYYDL